MNKELSLSSIAWRLWRQLLGIVRIRQCWWDEDAISVAWSHSDEHCVYPLNQVAVADDAHDRFDGQITRLEGDALDGAVHKIPIRSTENCVFI